MYYRHFLHNARDTSFNKMSLHYVIKVLVLSMTIKQSYVQFVQESGVLVQIMSTYNHYSGLFRLAICPQICLCAGNNWMLNRLIVFYCIIVQLVKATKTVINATVLEELL